MRSLRVEENPERTAAQEWLDPSYDKERIRRINKPLLIIHPVDDNNVNIKVSLYFYKLAKPILEEKGIPITFLKLPKGGGGITSIDQKINIGDNMKGHLVPKDVRSLKMMFETIKQFVVSEQKASAISSSLTDLNVADSSLKSVENYHSASLEQIFVNEAYKLYRMNAKVKTDTHLDFDRTWDQYYMPILKSLSFAHTLLTPEKKVHEFQWLSKLPDEDIHKLLKKQLPQFSYFAKEHSIIKNPLTSQQMDDLSTNSLLIETVRSWLAKAAIPGDFEDHALAKLLNDLVLANPQIVPQDYAIPLPLLSKAKEKLEQKLQQINQLSKKSWQSTVRAVQNKALHTPS